MLVDDVLCHMCQYLMYQSNLTMKSPQVLNGHVGTLWAFT